MRKGAKIVVAGVSLAAVAAAVLAWTGGEGGRRGSELLWRPASAQAQARAADAAPRSPVVIDRAPLRSIRDTYATFSAVAVNLKANEIVVQDENLFQILVYDRSTDTPATAAFTEPKRIIEGPDTELEFQCGIYVDPQTGEIYSVANDTTDKLLIFSPNAKGNAAPIRILHTPHGTFGISVDEARQEMYLAVEHSNSVVVYKKSAAGEDKPLRTLVGDKTMLADPHGVALDTKNGWMFVSNHGNADEPGGIGGRFDPPSITVYPMEANGDVAPIRTIAGPKTRLNWPAALAYDTARGELYVANDADDSVLVFKGTDQGNVAPSRVIRGGKTGLKNPTGIFLDFDHHEMVVSNMGNHSVRVFPLDANGDVAPLRTIRSAALGKTAMAIGNPGAVGYDTKREEILVPNCVAHPQIAIFDRLAKENSVPTRLLSGQNTRLSRTMHDIRYDAVNDEILVTNPFARALLVFRGSATGEEAPIRIIQGPKTLLEGPDRMEVDNVNNEFIVPEGDHIAFFSRTARGDVPPLRTIKGPDTQLRSADSVAVDTVHNLIVAGMQDRRMEWGGGGFAIFNRTDNGNVKPRAVIRGPKTEIVRITQVQVLSEKGWIVGAQSGRGDEHEPENTFIGVWSITDNGDIPPRWKFGGPKTQMKKPRGIVLNPKYKEIIVSDMRLNAIMSYSFPELFQ